ncbi:folate receptor family protein [Anaeramoeba ignava]|uniref:Folate receptor family protein n=1 Tax=Anaeramoeba ignava TaxID=1746090 RepID=A0A9Q0LFY2_ANAIG|nr:folate receptor family protein [Anaeramoeba ignava]
MTDKNKETKPLINNEKANEIDSQPKLESNLPFIDGQPLEKQPLYPPQPRLQQQQPYLQQPYYQQPYYQQPYYQQPYYQQPFTQTIQQQQQQIDYPTVGINTHRKSSKRPGYVRPRNYVICIVCILVCIGIITLIIVAIASSFKFKWDNNSYPYNGNGVPGLTCPARSYYLTKSGNNNIGECVFYDYTCARDDTVFDLSRDYSQIFTGEDYDSDCLSNLGYLQCAPMSPYINSFGSNIQIGENYQNFILCDFFCDTLYDNCKDATFDCSSNNPFPHVYCGQTVSSQFSDSKSFCQQGLYLTVSSDQNSCFAGVGSLIPSILILAFLSLFFFA